MRQHSAAFANFICRFGDEKVLLDYAARSLFRHSHGILTFVATAITHTTTFTMSNS